MTIDISKQLEEVIKVTLEKLIKSEFNASKDPYGKSWKPKKVPNGKPPLEDTGKLKSSFKYNISSNKISVTNKVSYFTEATEVNKVLPESTLPINWESEINKKVKRYLDQNFKKILKGK